MASAVTTPHPPALVYTTTLGPRGNGWVAKVAAASKASSTVAARITPACLQAPSKTLSSAARAPVCEAAARAPPGLAPPLSRTIGLRAARGRMLSKKARPSASPST